MFHGAVSCAGAADGLRSCRIAGQGVAIVPP